MPKLTDVIDKAAYGLNVTHLLKNGAIVHKATATYHFPQGTITEPIDVDIEPADGVEIVIVGAEVAPK